MENKDPDELRKTKCQVSTGLRHNMQRGNRSLSLTRNVVNFNTMPDIVYQLGLGIEP